MTCLICAKRKIPAGRYTRGDSYCQEADYHFCMARGSRKGSR